MSLGRRGSWFALELLLALVPLTCGGSSGEPGNTEDSGGADAESSDAGSVHPRDGKAPPADSHPREDTEPQGDAMTPTASGVFTYHNDNARTGQTTGETRLTPSNVDSAHFGKIFSQPVDGYTYAQPLYVPAVTIPGHGTHNAVYVATENDSVFAFDADTQQAPLWKVSFLGPGVTTVPDSDTGETGDLVPQIGITSTPAIDPAGGILYVVAKTKEPGPTYVYRIHALDLATGAEKLGGPVVVKATVAGTGTDSDGGVITFDTLHHLQRPALLLEGGVLYVAFGSHGDRSTWHGWVLGYDQKTLDPKVVYCTTPDADSAAIWQSGAGVAADAEGNLYFETGNGSFDGDMGGRDLGMSVVKLGPGGKVLDWFAPHDQDSLSAEDVDLGSSGPMIPPAQAGPHANLVIGSGKTGYLYVLDQTSLGHFNAKNDDQILQSVGITPNDSDITAGIFTTPVYWNGNVYVSAVEDPIRALPLAAGKLATTAASQSSLTFDYPGATLSVSSNGAAAGILWAVEGDGYSPSSPPVLHAYDATDLSKEFYNSGQASGGRDTPGPATKFAVPTIFGGKVYLGTQTELTVYGELP